MLLLSLLASVGVTLLWLWFFVRRDRHPEPLRLLARTFAWGCFAWVVAASFEASLGKLLGSTEPLALLLVALLTACIEEASKYLAASTATTEPEFDEPMDGLVYAVTAALGFALIENLTYVLGYGTQVATWHALLTTLAHALFSAPQGYALGARYIQLSRWAAAQGLLLSTLLHFVFNGLLTGGTGWRGLLALGLTVLLMASIAWRYYRHYEARAQEFPVRHAPTFRFQERKK